MYLLEELKKIIENNKKRITIFIDMDGVVADYRFGEGKNIKNNKPGLYLNKRPICTTINNLKKINDELECEMCILSSCLYKEQAEEKGFSVALKEQYEFISHEKEYEVIKLMGEFPMVIADAAAKRKPHLICNYINDLATAFHSLYNAEKVINEENQEKTNEKLALIKALEITIKNALELIGVTAPERM